MRLFSWRISSAPIRRSPSTPLSSDASAFSRAASSTVLVRIGVATTICRRAKGTLCFAAEFVCEAVPSTQCRAFQRILWIVHPGVVHAAVARAGRHAQLTEIARQEKHPATFSKPPRRLAHPITPPPMDSRIFAWVHKAIFSVRIIREY